MPQIDFSPIITVDQSAAVSRYLQGQGPKPTDLPQNYILPNGEPAHPAPSAPSFGPGAAPAKKFPWGWVAAGLVGVGLLALLSRRKGA